MWTRDIGLTWKKVQITTHITRLAGRGPGGSPHELPVQHHQEALKVGLVCTESVTLLTISGMGN
jgi:hypothetical protein